MLLSSLIISSLLALPSFASHDNLIRRHSGVARRHQELEKKDTSSDGKLVKRGFSGRMTYYLTGLGACGINNSPGDFIVALNSAQFGGGYPGPNCFKMITISHGGKTAQAQITDECPTCGYGELDLSEGLFTQFADTGAGIFNAEWWFNDDGPQQPPQQTTTSTPPPQTSTTPPPPETSTTKQQPTTTSSSSSSSSSSSTSSTSSTESKSSATPTSTSSEAASKTAAPTANSFDDIVQVFIGLSGVVGAGARL